MVPPAATRAEARHAARPSRTPCERNLKLVLIAAGGALGSLARYGVGLWLQATTGGRFPWDTLAVNFVGSFFMAFSMSSLWGREWLTEELRLALTVGVMGGFTTYSAFNQQTLGFLRERDWTPALLYPAVTLAACLVAGWAGLVLGRAFAPRA